MQFAKPFAAACLAATLAVPALAADTNPVGTWQSSSGESRYRVTMCGDGTKLCARLTWLRSDARTPQNLRYLNQTVVNGAVPTGPNEWKGMVSYDGQVFRGSLTMVSNDHLEISGCQIIFCQSMRFVRL